MAVHKKEDQIRELVAQSESILICLPERPKTDAIASSLALATAIERMGKKVKVASYGFQLPSNHGFLPKSESIESHVSSLKKFTISVNLKNASLEELSYAMEKDQLHIFLTPKNGRFTAEDVSSSDDGFMYDCAITVDAHDLESLGPIYEENTEFFYEVPIVNIDHSAKNDYYGQINLVDINATSVSEIVFEMLEAWDGEWLDEYIATQLLAGMISKTKSFQSGRVTPRSLSIASHLIDQGARRDEIVKHLYQSKSVDTLKLWGMILSRLHAHEEYPIVWSFVTNQEMQQTHSSVQTICEAVDELIINTPDAKNAIIFFDAMDEDGKKIENATGAVISTAPFIHAKKLFQDFHPHGTEQFIVIDKAELSRDELQRISMERLSKKYKETQKES